MFNTYKDAEKIKRILKKNKIPLIEDNAIYFDNYTIKNGKGTIQVLLAIFRL